MVPVKEAYKNEFGAGAITVRAPGRINLIGEHTDYNLGYVFPAAVFQSIHFAIGKSEGNLCTLISLDFNETYCFNISDFEPLKKDTWQNYILGVVAEIQKSGRQISGFNMVFGGNVPLGSGMSSSAALECGVCYALNQLFELNIPKLEMVKMSQLAEHNYVGVKCGIMDQFASMMGKENEALRLDCKTLSYDYFPVKLRDYALLLCNSNVHHSLASSEYNVRRRECEEGVAAIKKVYPTVTSLSDATLGQLETIKDTISEIIYKRCKYVIEENERVFAFSDALKKGDIIAAGNILKQAQKGMQNEYEVTCPEIDFMADFANAKEWVAGARMMGGGFGGCTLNLILKEREEEFISELNAAYKNKFGREITPIQVKIDNGVSLID